jgi:hypothetical protein
MAKKRTHSEAHAQSQLMLRYDGEVDWAELRAVVESNSFEYVQRQTGSRTLCSAAVGRHTVWFVLNRKEQSIVTVLTPEMAADSRMM